jgi:RNA binding exosome subunit
MENEYIEPPVVIKLQEVEQKVSELLNNLICPSREVMDWVSETMREHYQNTIENQRRIENSLRDQLDRIKRMDNTLYDDKLAGK